MNHTNAQLVWFKRDLRIDDHRPLMEAARRGPALCVFVLEDSWLMSPEVDRMHLTFLKGCLKELHENLLSMGNRLVVIRGECVPVLNRLWQSVPYARIWSHTETGNHRSYLRDQAVGEWCRSRNIEWKELRQNGVIRRLGSRDGWNSRWEKFMRASPVRKPDGVPLPGPLPDWIAASSWEGVMDQALKESRPRPVEDIPKAGSSAALEILHSFLHARGRCYTREMSSPLTAFESCSRLSPHITWGTLSLRTIYQAALARRDELIRDGKRHADSGSGRGPDLTKEWRQSLRSFTGRLHWHCHFMQKLEDEPELEFFNLCRAYDGMRENDWNHEYFQRWCEGLTGYPFVDACMRCLHQTGWLNFRMRAMVMSFASYHLWLHWREPALFLGRMFLDFEPGIHFSQVQMQSGTTGINSIRIYSPHKQAMDLDPDGAFIRRWVPELGALPAGLVHAPEKITADEASRYGFRPGHTYPLPVVRHSEAWHRARSSIARFRNTPEARNQADLIQQKHGSRRSGIARSSPEKAGRRSTRHSYGAKPESQGTHGGQLELPL